MSIDWNRSRQIVLTRLHVAWAQLSDYTRNLPRARKEISFLVHGFSFMVETTKRAFTNFRNS